MSGGRDCGFLSHDLRHTCTAWLVPVGTPLLEVSQVLRHASIVMTQWYAHLVPHHARSALDRLATLGDNAGFS
ncbi:MAG: tyrosine-type recombinase/integrase [Gammaproteobacteria bacterium]|nr:tyrosine-type recombinase/integrase [Gammaproteobacteria bacterium]